MIIQLYDRRKEWDEEGRIISFGSKYYVDLTSLVEFAKKQGIKDAEKVVEDAIYEIFDSRGIEVR